MMWLQEEYLEDLIARRQKAMAPTTPALQATLEAGIDSLSYLIALDLQRPSNLLQLQAVLVALTSEIASARDAVEHERALRRLI